MDKTGIYRSPAMVTVDVFLVSLFVGADHVCVYMSPISPCLLMLPFTTRAHTHTHSRARAHTHTHTCQEDFHTCCHLLSYSYAQGEEVNKKKREEEMCLSSWRSAVCKSADRLTGAPQPASTHLLLCIYFKRTEEDRVAERRRDARVVVERNG